MAAALVTRDDDAVWRVILAVVGAVLGGVVGLLIGVGTSYTLAALLGISSAEKQAYFRLVGIPAVGFVGLVSGAAGFAAFRPGTGRQALAIVGGAGWLAILLLLGIDIARKSPTKPAKFRVRNSTNRVIEHCFLGSDFRVSKKLGSIEPGQTTRYKRIDLDKKSTFVELRCVKDGERFELGISDAQRSTLAERGEYTYEIGLVDNQPTLTVKTDKQGK